jgi:hypothetical protein
MSPKARLVILRTLSVLPLVFCGFAWVWSYFYTEQITYVGTNRGSGSQIAVGELHFLSMAHPGDPPGWSYTHMHPDWEFAELYTGLPHWKFLGVHFFWGAHPYSPGVSAVIGVIPFWLLTLAASAIPACMWWRSRRNKPSRGFPVVEMNASD